MIFYNFRKIFKYELIASPGVHWKSLLFSLNLFASTSIISQNTELIPENQRIKLSSKMTSTYFDHLFPYIYVATNISSSSIKKEKKTECGV